MPSIEKRSAVHSYTGWMLLVIPLFLMVLFIIAPLFSNVIISLSNQKLLKPGQFVGLNNYADFFHSEEASQVLYNTFLSPLIFLRILLLVAAPLALALLLMEIRLGGRIAIQVILSPLILFSGAVILGLLYSIYYSPQGGLGYNLILDIRGIPVDRYAPEHLIAVAHNLLLSIGLALSIPLGIILFVGIAQGTRTLIQEKNLISAAFWSRAWRFLIIYAIAVTGFSLTGNEGLLFLFPHSITDNLLTSFYNTAFSGTFQFGYGAAIDQVLIIPLVILGIGLMLVLESSRLEISIRFILKIREKLTPAPVLRGWRLTGIILSGCFTLIVIILLLFNILLPWLGSIFGMFTGESTFSREYTEYFMSILQSLRIAFPSALICLAISVPAGFVLGFLKPHGARVFLFAFGIFIFITPALLAIPLFFLRRDLLFLDGITALVLQNIVSPLAIILFTWFFRGVRDELTAIGMKGNTVSAGEFMKRILGSLISLSIPVFFIYFLSSLNTSLYAEINVGRGAATYTLPLHLLYMQSRMLVPGLSTLSTVGFLSSFLYLLPLLLFIVSLIVILPRFALMMRQKADQAPVPEGKPAAKYKKEEAVNTKKMIPGSASLFSERIKRNTFLCLGFFCLAIISCVPAITFPLMDFFVLAFSLTGLVFCVILHILCVNRINKSLAVATGNQLPTTSPSAVLFHFIPFFNLYGIYKWTKYVSAFIRRQKPRRHFIPEIFLVIFYLSFAVLLILLLTFFLELALLWCILHVFLYVTIFTCLSVYMYGHLRQPIT